MIGNSNISLGPAYVISEDYAVKSQQAAAPNRPNAVAALVATNLNVQQQQQQQTNDNAHDRQHQPQDSPQDAEPEPIVDNDLSQVTSFPFCSQSKLHAYHHFCLKSSNLIIQINDRVFQSLGVECFVMTANLIKPVAHRAHTHTHQIIMQIFLEYQAIVPTDFPRNVTTLRSPHFSFVRSFYALFTRPYILPTLLGIVIVSFYCLHLLSLNCFTEIICAVHNTVWYDLPFKSVEE